MVDDYVDFDRMKDYTKDLGLKLNNLLSLEILGNWHSSVFDDNMDWSKLEVLKTNYPAHDMDIPSILSLELPS